MTDQPTQDDTELTPSPSGGGVSPQSITDVFALSPRQVADATFHDGARFYRDPSSLSPADTEARLAGLITLHVLAGDPDMLDPRLREQLPSVTIPALAVWGASDGLVSPAYGRALAASLATAGSGYRRRRASAPARAARCAL